MPRLPPASSSQISMIALAVAAAASELRRAACRLTGRLSLAALLLGALYVYSNRWSAADSRTPAARNSALGLAERLVRTAPVFQAIVHAGESDSAAGAVGEVAVNSVATTTAGPAGEVSVDQTADAADQERFVVLDTMKEQFVYSAHFDDRTSWVHIVGFKHRFNTFATKQLWCRYPGGSGPALHRMEMHSNVSVFYPKPGLLYNTFIWRCAVDPQSTRTPRTVDLVGDDGGAPKATLRVQYMQLQPKGRHSAQFGVCVKPMVNYSNLHQLVEFVEVHRLFGVSQFIIYDYSHSPAIDQALTHYVTAGIVILHRWPLPVPLEAVHDYGQKSMNHHCLMTYMNVFKYIAFIDLDEILVPIAPARSWSDIIAAAASSEGSKETDGAYVFRSSIFPMAAVNYSGFDCSLPNQPCKMATLVNRMRSDFYPIGSWSKPLVETRKTDLVDIHIVRRMMYGYTALDVSPRVAFLHHYRSVQWSTNETVADNGTEPFRNSIVHAVGAMFAKFSTS